MLTHEPSETQETTTRPRWSRVVIIVAVGALGVWAITNDGGPVATEDARIEMTFTGEQTSYSGDREVVRGTASITLRNETDVPVAFLAHRYDPGSDDLANDPGPPQEGVFFMPGDHQVPESAVELLEVDVPPGAKTWTLELRPGTYLFDVGYQDAHTTGVWRAAVVEVAAD